MKLVLSLLTFFLTMPIWYYLLYQILVRVNATDLMFFLYWVYVPFVLFLGVLKAILDEVAD